MATMMLKRAGICADCGRTWLAGAKARWFPKIGVLCADKADCDATIAARAKYEAEAAVRAKYEDPTPIARSMWQPEHAVEVATAVRTLCGLNAATVSHATPGYHTRVGCTTCRERARAIDDACQARLATPPAVQIAPVSDDAFAAGLEAARAMLAGVLS